MRTYWFTLALTVALFPATLLASQLQDIRVWPAPDSTRLVLDLSEPAKHTLFALENPHRLVVDLTDTNSNVALSKISTADGLLQKIRGSVRKGDNFRLVLDLKQKSKYKSYQLEPNANYGHRLVIELESENTPTAAVQGVVPTEQKGSRSTVKSVADYQPEKARDVIVAIDAGHGGEDPGALSSDRKLQEKDVVLAIAKKLHAILDAEPGMSAFLTRTGDYFIPLSKRTKIARERNADLFISIHADSFPDPRAYGTSVYTLSPRGASSEHARLLAQKENDSDLIGGVALDDKDDMLASVLLDLTQTASIEFSTQVADKVLQQLKDVNRLHKKQVEQAGFKVLKSPDMPSILIETAFISNPEEAKKLRSSSYQERFAKAILTGVRTYFYENPPIGTQFAKSRMHRINKGETLSGIAKNYAVTAQDIRRANDLKSNQVRIGQVITIPES